MKDFYIIGCDQCSMLRGSQILARPECRGVIVTDGDAVNKYMLPSEQQVLSRLKVFSLIEFLRYAKKNPGTILVSFYDFQGGRRLLQSLAKQEQFKLEIYDFCNFAFDHNIPMMYRPAADERNIILDAMKEWKEFRKYLTDDFSKFSLDCYLEGYEKKNRYELAPAYVGWEHLYLNAFSRKMGMVPNNEEIYVDVGAWNGDTVVKFVDACADYRAIHAFEPIKRIFPKLQMRETYLDNLHTYPIALSNFTGEIEFVDNDTMGSHVPEEGSASTNRVTCSRLDDILDEATMMKIEVEGHESRVLEGAAGIIKNCHPEICAQGYHYPLDPIRIMETVKKIHDYRHVALRFNAVNFHLSSVFFSDRAPFE